MRRLFTLIALLTSFNLYADDAQLQLGQEVYEEWCVICHGPDERGTAILTDRYKDIMPGELAKRTNLTPELITLRVRGWSTPCLLYTSPSPRDA